MNPAIDDVLPEGLLGFVIVTAEQNALELAEFLPSRYALAANGVACLARAHSRDPDDVSRVCDMFDGGAVQNHFANVGVFSLMPIDDALMRFVLVV